MKALATFLNSSIGVLGMLGARDNRKPSYPQFSQDTLRRLPVPDFNSDSVDRDTLADAFDSLCDEVLLPLSQMHEDPVRQQLDAAVIAALGLDPDWVAEIRRSLAEEPSITNRRFGEAGS